MFSRCGLKGEALKALYYVIPTTFNLHIFLNNYRSIWCGLIRVLCCMKKVDCVLVRKERVSTDVVPSTKEGDRVYRAVREKRVSEK